MNKEALRFIKYLSFKMDCAREQEALGWDLDLQKAIGHRDELEKIVQDKTEELIKVMPPVRKYKSKNKPKVLHKQCGELSSHGKKWYLLLKEMGLPENTEGPLEIFDKYEEPKPSSPQQVKDWLTSLGWEPCTFDYKRDDDGKERKIPQVRKDGLLTDSVLNLIEVNPEVEVLDGLTVAQHRKSIFQGMIDSCLTSECGRTYVRATMAGFTNTLRFKHSKPLVNLPGVDKPWGEEIRGCLKAPEGQSLVGCDMVSLEDTTKRHYIKPLDPEYVAEMEQPGYDPHLSLALFSGAINQEQYDNYNEEPELKAIRKDYKVTNYSAVYGVGKAKLARTTGMKVVLAGKLLKAYWEKNWAVKKVAESRITKEVDKEIWMYNDVSGFWYSLRYDKDRFSTTNQSTGVFVFDTFVVYCRANGAKVCASFHDEVAVPTNDLEETYKILDKSCVQANKRLGLNVDVKIDYKSGKTYAEVH